MRRALAWGLALTEVGLTVAAGVVGRGARWVR